MSAQLDHARRWAKALTSDTDTALGLYAEQFTFDDRADEDHVFDTAITKTELRPRLAHYSNKDVANGVGIHRFEVRDAFPLVGQNGLKAVVTLWTWTGSHLETFHGLAVKGKTLSTIGITWHQLDGDGKVVREQTVWNDTPLFKELGVPVQTPRYWEAGFGA